MTLDIYMNYSIGKKIDRKYKKHKPNFDRKYKERQIDHHFFEPT